MAKIKCFEFYQEALYNVCIQRLLSLVKVVCIESKSVTGVALQACEFGAFDGAMREGG